MLGLRRCSLLLLKTEFCVKNTRSIMSLLLSVSDNFKAITTAQKLIPEDQPNNQLVDLRQLKTNEKSILLNNLGFTLKSTHNSNGLDLLNVEKISDLACITVDTEVPIPKFQALMKHLEAFKVLGVPKCLLTAHSSANCESVRDYNRRRIITVHGEDCGFHISKMSANHFITTSTSSNDATLRIWNADTATCKVWDNDVMFRQPTVVLNDGRIVCAFDYNIRIYDPKTKLCIQTLEGHTGFLGPLIILSDNTIVSSSEDCTIRLWNPDTGESLKVLKGFARALCAISEDILASADWHGIIRLWNVKTGERVKVLGEINPVCIFGLCKLSDERLVSGGIDRRIRIWNIETGICERVLLGHSDAVTALDVLPDGRLVSVSYDKTIRIWNTTTGACEYFIETEESEAKSMVVLQDGRIVYSVENELFIRG